MVDLTYLWVLYLTVYGIGPLISGIIGVIATITVIVVGYRFLRAYIISTDTRLLVLSIAFIFLGISILIASLISLTMPFRDLTHIDYSWGGHGKIHRGYGYGYGYSVPLITHLILLFTSYILLSGIYSVEKLSRPVMLVFAFYLDVALMVVAFMLVILAFKSKAKPVTIIGYLLLTLSHVLAVVLGLSSLSLCYVDVYWIPLIVRSLGALVIGLSLR